ncbi:MAG: GIY-YIG nuclease family protein, partial [Deltaproteobacteria bacterium]|nr:GIY-YIG nuclease family protein [Deltaproteobacteria bacterium]
MKPLDDTTGLIGPVDDQLAHQAVPSPTALDVQNHSQNHSYDEADNSIDSQNAEPQKEAARLEAIKSLRAQALDLPPSPGVYLMKDSRDRVLYVGKAKVLPRRVSSYFRAQGLSPRITLLVERVTSFDFIVTATEKEALILENNLIKQYRPKFNVVLRDDKTYPSLRLAINEPFPRLEIVRRPIKDGSVIFGPFPSAGSLRETLKQINRIFPLRKCARP